MISRIGAYASLARPKHWVKNWFVTAPLIFSNNIGNVSMLKAVFLAVVSFSLLASSIYCLNDVIDRENDLQHPEKKGRPLAAGTVSTKEALALSLLLATSGLGLAYTIKLQFAILGVVYLAMFILYSLYLKRLVLLDVMMIAAGFTLRVFAGAVVIGVAISHWIILCTILLATFLGLCKRRHELQVLGVTAIAHRRILHEYSPYLVDQLMLASATLTLISYALYTVAPETVARFKTDSLIFTFPFVLYGVFRYLYLVHVDNQGDPVGIVFSDRPMVMTVAVWFASTIAIIYWKF